MSSNNDIEAIIAKEGFYIFAGQGGSMVPLIHEAVDTVEIRACDGPLKKGDVILYTAGGRYVLHRVHAVKEGYCITRGDNCIKMEHVDNKDIIGKMTCLWRGEKHIDVNGFFFRAYSRLIVDLPVFMRFCNKAYMKLSK